MTEKTTTLRRLLLAGLAAVLIPTLGACNTVRGAGKDIENGGEAIQNGAENVQEDIAN